MKTSELKRNKLVYAILCIVFLVIIGGNCFCFINNDNSANAITDKVVISDDLLNKNYSSIENKKYFNADVLSQLYEKLLGKGADYAQVETASKKTKSGIENIHSGLNSYEIRGKNGGSDVVLKLAGINWIVTSLTSDSDNNAILTLWLEDSTFSSEWGKVAALNFNDTYPTSVYSSSYIRARLLNGKSFDSAGNRAKVGYLNKAGSSTLVDYTADDSYPFKVFSETVDENKDSIIDFLVQPKKISYQHTQDNRAFVFPERLPNEALDIFNDGWHSNGTIGVQNCTIYSDWGNDYLWLPSITETGWTYNGGSGESVGLWNTLRSTRSSGSDTALRTGDNDGCDYVWHLTNDGRMFWAKEGTVSYSIRPAIHLNLTLAEQSKATSIDVPDEFRVNYNTSEQGAEEQSWYAD
ncbi:MAG: hypothetical protein OSJ74_05720, partial [Clostridia bacterium]|nr:hypothetical protein [Clostridia bacterium]